MLRFVEIARQNVGGDPGPWHRRLYPLRGARIQREARAQFPVVFMCS